MSHNSSNISDQKISRLNDLLNSAYKKIELSRIASAFLFFMALATLFLSLISGIESSLYLPPVIKTAGLSVAIIFSLVGSYLIIRAIGYSKRNQFIDNYLKTRTSDGENIQSALDLHKSRELKSSVFYDAALESNLQHIKLDHLKEDVGKYANNHRAVKFAGYLTVLLAIAIITFTVTVYSSPDGFNRTITFWESYEQPNPYQFTVTPGSATIEQGQQITPSIKFTDGNLPDNVTLSYKTDVEENYRERPMRFTNNSEFQAHDIEVTSTISYHVLMDGFKSETYTLDVQIQPRFDDLIATIIPPEYTNLPEKKLEYPFSTLNFYTGSVIRFEGNINKPIENLTLVSDQETKSFAAEEGDTLQSFTAELTPTESDTLMFQMSDHDGLQNKNPFRTFLQVVDDESPVVIIREPSGEVMQNEPRDIDILYQVTDDFGVDRADLYWEIHRSFVEDPESNSMQLNTPENGRNTRFTWDVSDIELRPRDEIRFQIRAMDNDAVAGGKWGQSQEVIIRVPSMAEFFDEIDSKERDVQGELDQVSDSFEQMEQEYERFLERLRQSPEGGFEEQEMLENVSEQQRQIDETVEELKQQFEELRKDMEESSSVSEETRESYRELQQLMDELEDPDLQNALRELREAMENMNPNQLEQALEEVSFNEELYKERLERTKELFKQLKMNSDLDKLAQQYEDLAERTKEKPESTLEQLKQEMESATEDMDQVQEQLDRLDNNPPKRSEEQLREF